MNKNETNFKARANEKTKKGFNLLKPLLTLVEKMGLEPTTS